jgi:hypothetical protein
MTTAITEYSKTEAALSDLAQRYKDVVFDVSTPAGMSVARKGRGELRGLRVSLEKTRVEIKGPALERCRLIDAEAKRITAELLALETPIDTVIKNEEQRKEREKAEKDRIEAERIAGIQAAIDRYAQDALAMAGRSSSEIEKAIAGMHAIAIGDSAAEFKEQALAAKSAAITKLNELHAAALEQEAEQARIKAEREELSRLRAEQEQRAREEQARIAEETRKRAEAEAAARAKIEAQERASRERIEAEERKARLVREEADRKARETLEAEQREARKKQAEEDAWIKSERERIEAKRREIEARERKAREAEEAKQREIQRQANELSDAREMLETFRARFGHRKEFEAVVDAINEILGTTQEQA